LHFWLHMSANGGTFVQNFAISCQRWHFQKPCKINEKRESLAN
jgi:hypothetical protein